MAARRLLIVLVLLLAASIVAAALAPERRGSGLFGDSSPTTSTTTTTAPEPQPAGASLEVRIDASVRDPETIRAAPGDQLALAVGVPAEPARTIAIDEFGLTDFAAPLAPARFNLLLRQPGEFAITDEQGEVVGRIVVAADERGGKGDAAAPADGAAP